MTSYVIILGLRFKTSEDRVNDLRRKKKEGKSEDCCMCQIPERTSAQTHTHTLSPTTTRDSSILEGR